MKTLGALPEWNLEVPIEKNGVWELRWSVEGEKNVSIMVYKEGVSTPIESINYYIRREPSEGREAGS